MGEVDTVAVLISETRGAGEESCSVAFGAKPTWTIGC